MTGTSPSWNLFRPGPSLSQGHRYRNLAAVVCGLWLGASLVLADPSAALPSWRPGAARSNLVAFVTAAVTDGSEGFLTPRERIAVFDLDGTLLCEKPNYLGALVAEARLREKAQAGNTGPLYEAALAGDHRALKKAYREVYLEAFAGESQTAYANYVRKFIREQTHPRFGQPYARTFFQPMLELAAYLQKHGFKVYVVSTSNQEFIRAFSEGLLGIPREQVIGSMAGFSVDLEQKPAAFLREPYWWPPYNAGKGKALRIRERIGRVPAFACGNGSHDLPMLRLTDSLPGPHFVAVLDHDDGEREYVYHKKGLLNTAAECNWTVIRFSEDFRQVFP